MREIATYACYTSKQIPLKSVHVPICHSAWWHLKILSALTLLFTYELKSWSAWGPAIKHLAVWVWLLNTNTSAQFEAIVRSFFHIATCFKSPQKLSFLYILIGTFAFLSLPTLPPPLDSVSGQLRLCGARAVAIGRLGQCVAIRLPLLGCGCACMWSLRAGGAHE